MFTFSAPRPPRWPSLTPMIDVVFLLLVFFMLTARFGQDKSLPVSAASGGEVRWQGPPRLIKVNPETLLLNGVAVAGDALSITLTPLMPDLGAPILLRAGKRTDLARFVAIIDDLRSAGFTRLIIVE